MTKITGKGVSGGIAFGKLHVLQTKKQAVPHITVDNPSHESERLQIALTAALQQLSVLHKLALTEVGDEEAAIFEVHQMMLEDEDYLDSICGIITEQSVNAEYAVSLAADKFAEMFANMADEYMQGRAADVRDISDRLIKTLLNEEKTDENGLNGLKLKEKSIVAADDLMPSQTLQLDKSLAMGFITVGGSQTSHTAILARTMGVPAIVNAADILTESGKPCIMDGSTGEIFINPDAETVAKYEKKTAELAEKRRLLQALKGKPTITPSGHKVKLFANIGSVADVALALENDAEGIGLFRTEFVYLDSKDYPTEQQQFEIYRQVVEKMGGRNVVFRTIDIGADKQTNYFQLAPEENPALGLRGIRICLTRPELFKTQLRALYRASAFGNLSIMFPMIISKEEVAEVWAIAAAVRAELDNLGITYDKNVELGIMIETPAAAIISRDLADLVDFFSIGTNDLTQYTLALDRQNQVLERFYNPHHSAVLQLIKMVAEAAHAAGIWVGICGELGADLQLTGLFMDWGIDELSVSPPAVLGVRERVLRG
ncbi:MAG: phosphoenolpyruvate--protein phosphotransferase [Defluviitaleaceae bacterium]|nr:phosphoenolpyruvate--protein phosphotransferase [Defluviitaleaceae bacterium]